MRELIVSQPYPDPHAPARRSSPDWLVVLRAGDRVDVHRFIDQDDACAFVIRARELAEHPELDTNDSERDERAIEALSSWS